MIRYILVLQTTHFFSVLYWLWFISPQSNLEHASSHLPQCTSTTSYYAHHPYYQRTEANTSSPHEYHQGSFTSVHPDYHSQHNGNTHSHAREHYHVHKGRNDLNSNLSTSFPSSSLATDDDTHWLSEFLCFVRSHCIELYLASHHDVSSRLGSKKVTFNPVGTRCRFCAHCNSLKKKEGQAIINLPLLYKPYIAELDDDVKRSFFGLPLHAK